MTEAPVFTVIAGINGAGKTSLYHVLRESRSLGERVNIDELAKGFGNWRDPRTQIAAGRAAMKRIGELIAAGRSFHIETTLPGAAVERQVTAAVANGFRVRLYYVGVDDVSIAVERVHRRMAHGGHGIEDRYILRRYEKMNARLRRLLPFCDEAVLFDNTVRFRQIAILKGDSFADCDRDLPLWFLDLVEGPEETDGDRGPFNP